MTYKTLDAEEAEEEFAQRGKVLNKWAVMVHKKLKPDQDDAELDGEEADKKKGQAGKKDLKISDMDDWEGSDDGLDTDDEKKKKDDDSDDDGRGKKKGKDARKKEKNKEEKDEAFDDSEDDDRQDREVDYMSDESSAGESSEEEKADAKEAELIPMKKRVTKVRREAQIIRDLGPLQRTWRRPIKRKRERRWWRTYWILTSSQPRNLDWNNLALQDSLAVWQGTRPFRKRL